MIDEKALEAAVDQFAKFGIRFYLPSEGDLDDVEREQYDALCAAITAYEAAKSAEPVVTDEMVQAIGRIRNTAMIQAIAARIPESGDFAGIAQDADWLFDILTAALKEAGG